MAKILSGPNFLVNSKTASRGELLSTADLLDPKSGVVYSGGSADPFEALYDKAYATSILSEEGVDLGIDYSNYENFIHFSSAKDRLEHFKDKVASIQYHASQSLWIQQNLTATSTYQTETIDYHITQAEDIIKEFDGYDRHLYFGKGATSWPKDSNGELELATSGTATTWYNAQLEIADDYDLNNQNRLTNTLPEFVREDSNNEPVLVFCDMLGHHYDLLMNYAQGITQKHTTDNRLNIGASRDLLAEVLKGFGVKLYESQFSTSDLARLYTGEFFPTGSEDIDTMVSASADIPSSRDHLDEINKRLFHNIAHLLQVKGTKRGLRALVNAFGIPADILKIKEYGGVSKSSQNFGITQGLEDTQDKIRTDKQIKAVSGSLLDRDESIESVNYNYSYDIHAVDIGWSPNDLKDEHIKTNLPADFNIDKFLGDPRDAHKTYYTDLETRIKSLFSATEDRTIYDFLRTLRWFDNQMFKMLEDFAPARTSLRKGAIIRPHVLERNKAGLGETTASQEDYSATIQTAFPTGSEGGVVDGDTTNDIVNKTTIGNITETINDQRERLNGELGGSVITVSNGELNPNNELKRPTNQLLNYDVQVETNYDLFYNIAINNGGLMMFYEEGVTAPISQGGGLQADPDFFLPGQGPASLQLNLTRQTAISFFRVYVYRLTSPSTGQTASDPRQLIATRTLDSNSSTTLSSVISSGIYGGDTFEIVAQAEINSQFFDANIELDHNSNIISDGAPGSISISTQNPPSGQSVITLTAVQDSTPLSLPSPETLVISITATNVV